MNKITDSELIDLQTKKYDLRLKKQELIYKFNKGLLNIKEYIELNNSIKYNIDEIDKYIEKER